MKKIDACRHEEAWSHVSINEKSGVCSYGRLILTIAIAMGYSQPCVNTREQILEAAWELYSARGFEDVSVRDVTTAAGVNLASVSYHFGGKEGLMQETVKRCMNPINSYRIQLLEQAIAKYGGEEKLPLRSILEAFMRPLVMPEECGVQSGLMLRLVARYLIESDYAIPSVSRDLYTEAFQVFVKTLLVRLPHLTPETLVKHIVFASGSVVYYHGLGKLALQLSHTNGGSSGGSSGSSNTSGSDANEHNADEIDREQMLCDVIEFAMHGFGGDTHGAVDA